MKQPYKFTALFSIFVIACLIQAAFEINDFLLIFLMCGGFAIVWFISEAKLEVKSKSESEELMAQIRSTSKDAKMKHRQLVTIVSALPFPILLIDQFGKITLYNTRLSQFGSIEDIENMTYLHNGFLPKIQDFLKDAYILEKELDKIIQIDNYDYQALSLPIKNKNRFSGCLILFQDITKTLAGEKMQKRFIADASHELKTPISIIKGMVEILNRDDFHDDAVQKDFTKQIAHEVERLDIIVKDMLQLSRLSIDHPILQRRKCDLNGLVDNVILSFQNILDEKQLALTKDYSWHGEVFVDPSRMTQVINNLLSNAIKYGGGGNINIGIEDKGNEILLFIRDEGHGFSEDVKSRIFERFYRVDDARTREQGGSGLGLAIVKSIIDAHGARIEVESSEKNGTQFNIYLKN